MALLSPPARLSPRQFEVLRLLAEGLSNSQIARRLFVGEATVSTHVGDIYSRLGARNRAHCVHLAHGAGLLAD
jgi:DNA-binding NarL/FixJ family response regulator